MSNVQEFENFEITNLKLSHRLTERSDTIIISITGQLDSFNSDGFQKAMRFITPDYKNIIFNMANCSFVASTGIGAFVFIFKTMKEKDGKVLFAHISPKIYEVFQLLGFTSFFPFLETVQDCLKNLENDEKKKEIFPFIFKCPVCNKKLRAQKNGRFRCKGCKTIISIDSFGNIRKG